MSEALSTAIKSFEKAFVTFLAQVPTELAKDLGMTPDGQEWLELLRFKLAPNFAGEPCLIVALCGGTNTGKSTVYNLLLGKDISPVRATAAATCRPVLAVSVGRSADALAGKLVPEFEAMPLNNAESALNPTAPETRIFVVTVEGLPERIALLDTPDVDSIDQQNWELAKSLRSAGDVVIAVLTGEKYMDQQPMLFFRQTHAAGRLVLPLMNKAMPEREYEIARGQLNQFVKAVGLPVETPCFVAPYDAALGADFGGKAERIMRVDGGETLLHYLEAIDVVAMKRRVYQESIVAFAKGAGKYLEEVEETALQLREVEAQINAIVLAHVEKYNPAPGAAVGGLLHAFVQSKRGAPFRAIGKVSEVTARGIGAVGRGVSRALFPEYSAKHFQARGDDAVYEANRESVVELSNDLAAELIGFSQRAPEPMRKLLESGLDKVDTAQLGEAVSRATLRHENISEAFRAHATGQMEDWWENHPVKRNALLAVDGSLAVAPAVIAGVMASHTGGMGVPETMIVAGPMMEQFLVRVMEYQFGDALFGLLKPWREEQRQFFREALRVNLLAPALKELKKMLDVLDGDSMREMKRQYEACLQGMEKGDV